MEKFLQVGVISNTHGIAGELKVFPTTDDVRRFKKLKEVILEPEKENQVLHITQVKFVKNMAVLRFREFDNINQVQGMHGKGLYVTREHAVNLEKNEFFIPDLIGLEVYTTDGTRLGVLQDVMQTGANDVYEVKKEDGTQILLPAIRDCIRDIDLEKGIMQVYLIPGLE